MGNPPPWRQTVQAAAREAAIAETRAVTATNAIKDGAGFNYRWEHVQAVVRLAIRLAGWPICMRESVT